MSGGLFLYSSCSVWWSPTQASLCLPEPLPQTKRRLRKYSKRCRHKNKPQMHKGRRLLCRQAPKWCPQNPYHLSNSSIFHSRWAFVYPAPWLPITSAHHFEKDIVRYIYLTLCTHTLLTLLLFLKKLHFTGNITSVEFCSYILAVRLERST